MDKWSKIASVQEELAVKWKCDPNVFIKSEDKFFQIVTFGKNVVIKAHPSIYKWCIESFSKTSSQDIMDGENLFTIETKLREFNKKLAGEHNRYLYLDNSKVIHKPKSFQYKLFDKTNINTLYAHKGFDNALNYLNDVIALGAYKENQLVTLAGADDGMKNLWQIGIYTLSEYRNKGLASYLVKTLADEIERRGMLPYYTTWSANLASTSVALKSGFVPVWVEYYSVDM